MDIIDEVIDAMNGGRQADALALLHKAYSNVASGAPGTGKLVSMTFFMWSRLVLDYPPAREAWRRLRDEQAALLLQGDERFGEPGHGRLSGSRFAQVCDMNRALQESHATYALFVQLDQIFPERAARDSHIAIAAVVEAGDFSLAERYLDDPLKSLAGLNHLATKFPLYPGHGEAPRLEAELSNFVQTVKLTIATLRGLGRPVEADAWYHAALTGLESEELRKLAMAELAEPGFDTPLLVRRLQRENEGQPGPGPLS